MKRLVATHGQHFLRGKARIAELVGHSNIRKNNTVVDIGAGSGAITSVLAQRARQVIAYEPEPVAASALRQHMADIKNVTVVERDFLTAPLPGVPYKVFANIPFHLSSQIVRKLVTAEPMATSVYLLTQKQFAKKLITTGSHFHGALGMAISPWWVARIRLPLKKTDFTPPPAVDTVLLELKPRDPALLSRADMSAFMEFVEGCYATPAAYTRSGAPRDKRPSQLAVEEWVTLFRRRPR